MRSGVVRAATSSTQASGLRRQRGRWRPLRFGPLQPRDVGWKALMGALSDLAAMGARPIGALVALCVPSDGLALDLHRLADASGVGFILSTIPVADGATREEALGGGEDYELLMTFAPTDVAAFEQRCEATGLRPPLAIGDVLADPQARLLNGDALDRKGWQHTLG
jgi:thiamine monophosphate kinase